MSYNKNKLFVLITQTVQDGLNRYTENYIETLTQNQNIQEEEDRRRKELNDDLGSSNRALRRFDIQEINEEEYNVLRKYL